MLRFVEVGLFLVPFALFLAWRLLFPRGAPSLRIVAVAAALTAVLAGALIWLRQEDAEPANATYVPAQMQDGRIIPGTGAPP